MTNPELLLLDEITSALDPMLVGEVLDMVAELKEQGTTILMATHEMSFAHDAADRIVLLRHGVIAENGTPQQVMDESQDPETRVLLSFQELTAGADDVTVQSKERKGGHPSVGCPPLFDRGHG